MKRILIACVLVCASLFSLCSCANEKKDAYNEAKALIASGDYETAYNLLAELDGYKDSDELLERFYYMPVKVTRTDSDDTSYSIETTLNEHNLIAKETKIEKGEITKITEYVYNDKYQCVKVTMKGADGEINNDQEMIYDANGNCIRIVFKDADGEVESTADLTYDAKGNCIKVVQNDGENDVFVQEDTYLENGNILKRRYIYESGDETLITYTYDNNGRLIKELSSDSGEATITQYTYDEKGNLIRRTVGEDVYLYTYDASGKLIKLVCPEYKSDDLTQDPEYEDDDSTQDSSITTSITIGGWFTEFMLGMIVEEYAMKYDDDGNIQKLVALCADGKTKTYDFEHKFVYVPTDKKLDIKTELESKYMELSSVFSMLEINIGGTTGSNNPIEGPLIDIEQD